MNGKLNITTFPDYETLSSSAAEYVFKKITGNQTTLGLPTGSTPVGMYKQLIQLFSNSHSAIQPFNLTTFNLDEYYPIKKDDPQSYHYFMTHNFWQPYSHLALPRRQAGIQPFSNTQFFIPNGESADPEKECQRYEELIQKQGPIDLMILGVGTNGHIGFNEPGSSPDSRTRVVDLSEETIQANSRFFSSEKDVPRKALTMGLGTILASREIIVLASGESKKPILQKLVSLKEPTPSIPASYLMTHPRVTWFVDHSAYPASATTFPASP